MNTTLTLVDLGGAIALLIWGVHMVQTGITRAFGPQLRRMLSYALGNRFKAFLAGVGVTSILQSSTATGLMVTAFAAGGLVDLVPALVVMLGANVGTTLIVQVLSFDVSRVSFLLILIGVFMFRRSGVTRTRDLGRVGIGLGLMLIALQHLLSMITPYEDVPSLRILLGAVTTDPLIDILLAAGLTWAAHSSVAVVLLIMSFAAQAVVPPHAAFARFLTVRQRTIALGQGRLSSTAGLPPASEMPVRSGSYAWCHNPTSPPLFSANKLIAYPGQLRRTAPTGARDRATSGFEGFSITSVRVGKAKSMPDCFARSMIRNSISRSLPAQ